MFRADCLDHLGKHRQSLTIFQNLLKDDPGDLSLLYACTDLLIDLKRYKDADKILDKLIALDPESGDYLNFKADIALQTGKFNECIRN